MWNITSNICGIKEGVWQGVTPFQGWLVGAILPRALPWAIICHPFRVMGNFELLEYYSYVTFLGFLLPIKPDMSHLVTCISKPTYHL